MNSAAATLVRAYYAAFNAANPEGMLALLTDDVCHDINEGGREVGAAAFGAFLARMEAHYREQVSDLVVMTGEDGTRAAAEFTIHGTYLKTDAGLPEAHGQTYVLPVGAFFELRGGHIARVTTHYNLAAWTRQVSGGPAGA